MMGDLLTCRKHFVFTPLNDNIFKTTTELWFLDVMKASSLCEVYNLPHRDVGRLLTH